MTWNPRTIGLVGVGAAVVAGLMYVTFRTEPVPVDIHVVASGPMQVTIDADGKTQIRDLFEVSAPIAGTALRSPVEVGDLVAAGQTVVAVVEPITPSLLDARSRIQAEASVREAQAALHVAETELSRAQENQLLAQSQFDRAQALVERGVSTLSSFEDFAQRLAVANATVEAAQARIDMANSSLERSRAALIEPDLVASENGNCCVEIYSPTDGVVLSVSSTSERPVAVGSPLLSIGDPHNIELVVDLLSTDAVGLGPGTTAIVERWGGPNPLNAVLLRVEPTARTKVSALGIEEQRVNAVFDITSPLADRPTLGDGFSAFVRVIKWQNDDAVQVPLSAIFKRGEEWAAFVAVDNYVEERRLSLGQRNNRMAEVLDGLEVGELVITHPNDSLSVGSLIIDRSEL